MPKTEKKDDYKGKESNPSKKKRGFKLKNPAHLKTIAVDQPELMTLSQNSTRNTEDKYNQESKEFDDEIQMTLFDGDNNSSDSSSDELEDFKETKKPAWIDEGDSLTCQEATLLQGKNVDFGKAAENDYKKSLEQKFQSVMGVPKWAKRRVTSEKSYLTSTGSLVTKSSSLQKGTIEIQKLKDLNKETYTEGPKITSTLFHPTSTVGLVAGVSGVVSLFQVDGKTNTKLQSIQYRKFPIHCAAFLKNGEQFIVGSSYHHYFYTHDLISGKSDRVANSRISDITHTKKFRVSPDGKLIVVLGKFGNLHVLSASTKELICTLKMNGDVGAVEFIDNIMYSTGSEGVVYVWDMNSRLCVHKFFDDGCLLGSALAASPDGNFLACGSNTGVVNIYDVNIAKQTNTPSPFKTILNMVTHINCLKFNATSEILCMTSHEKDNAIKLLHCPSMTVFSNFPSFQAKLNRSQCCDFSPNSGYLTFGDSFKTAHLFRLKYYGNY